MTSSIDRTRLSIFNLAVSEEKKWIGRYYIDGNDNNGGYYPYLENLQTLYKPFIWSYDFYPILSKLVNNSPTNELDIKYNSFYKYLKFFSRISRKYNSKFWAYAMCMEHYQLKDNDKINIEHYRPAPSKGELRFEIFNALAFGAQGIVYYQFGIGDPKVYIEDRSGQVDVKAPLEFEFNFEVEYDPEKKVSNLVSSDEKKRGIRSII